MLQRFVIALAQVKADLLNEIRQMVFIVCIKQEKSVKKVYNNIIKSIQS